MASTADLLPFSEHGIPFNAYVSPFAHHSFPLVGAPIWDNSTLHHYQMATFAENVPKLAHDFQNASFYDAPLNHRCASLSRSLLIPHTEPSLLEPNPIIAKHSHSLRGLHSHSLRGLRLSAAAAPSLMMQEHKERLTPTTHISSATTIGMSREIDTPCDSPNLDSSSLMSGLCSQRSGDGDGADVSVPENRATSTNAKRALESSCQRSQSDVDADEKMADVEPAQDVDVQLQIGEHSVSHSSKDACSKGLTLSLSSSSHVDTTSTSSSSPVSASSSVSSTHAASSANGVLSETPRDVGDSSQPTQSDKSQNLGPAVNSSRTCDLRSPQQDHHMAQRVLLPTSPVSQVGFVFVRYA